MNLIEKLGGYEEAKKLHDNVSCGSTATYVDGCFYSKESLGLFLLEYRRENNIFEPEDIVTYNDSDFIYSIDTINSDGFHATTVHEVKRCIIALFGHDKIKHATDEEIKAGHRL